MKIISDKLFWIKGSIIIKTFLWVQIQVSLIILVRFKYLYHFRTNRILRFEFMSKKNNSGPNSHSCLLFLDCSLYLLDNPLGLFKRDYLFFVRSFFFSFVAIKNYSVPSSLPAPPPSSSYSLLLLSFLPFIILTTHVVKYDQWFHT